MKVTISTELKLSITQKKIQYRPSITLPEKLWSSIQKNGDGSTKNIDEGLLRENIELAISNTGHQLIKVDKVPIAELVVSLEPSIDDAELKDELTKITSAIRKANKY